MLATAVGIISPASIGGGQYTLNLYFSDGTKAKFLRVGDYVQSGVSSNLYSVVTWSGYPSDFASGSQITVSFVSSDVIPPADSGFNSLAYTPNQLDVRPAFRTDGLIGNISIYSGQNFEYQLQASWNDLAEASNAIVGDSIVDSNGKEFVISFLTANKFDDPFRVTEKEKEGTAPVSGIATTFRPTLNEDYYQGNALSDPARTNILNRDKVLIDAKLKSLEDLIGSAASGASVEIPLFNGSGSTLSQLIPVRSDTSGELGTVDPSIEAEVKAILGITKESISSGASGPVVAHGRIENITHSANFGDAVYLSKTGGVTNVEPDIGVGGFVAGDFVIKLGVISKNITNPLQKDLEVAIELVGQL